MIVWCFGDSWTWGSELWDNSICTEAEAINMYGEDFTVTCESNHPYVMKNNWSYCLQQLGDYEVSNFAIPGSSNRQILETLYYQLKSDRKPDIIIIGWSTQYRWSDRIFDHVSKQRPVDKFSSVTSNYSDLFYEDNFYNEVCTAHWISSGVPILNINAFYNNKTNNLFDNRVKFLDKTMLDIATNGEVKDITKLDWHLMYSTDENRYKNLKSNGHPDEYGHKLIAQYIDKYIRS